MSHKGENIVTIVGFAVFIFLISLNIPPFLPLILMFVIWYYGLKLLEDTDNKTREKKLKKKIFTREIGIIESYKKFFNSFNPPLTDNQKIAVVTDKGNNLIISGAGTGKTTTIIAKILFLLESKKCNEDEILLIVFTKAAGEELRSRLEDKIGKNKIIIKTIHAFAKNIIENQEKKKPTIANFLDSHTSTIMHIDGIIKELCIDNINFKKSFVEFFQHYSVENIDGKFKSEQEYLDYLQANPFYTIKGDYVKSFGELSIANFLYSNGISYEYEDMYRPRTSDSHKPDFHIKDSNVYIEYFGLDRKGNTRKDIDNHKYKKDMEWKRSIHEKNKTILIEIFFYDIIEESWQEKLKESLVNNNIDFYPKSINEIYDQLPKYQVTEYSKLVLRFLDLDKAKLKNKEPSNARQSQFLKLYNPIKNKYEESLGTNIDFNDMVNTARDYLDTDSFKHKFKYIIVDEFQDISMSDCNFIKSLLSGTYVSAKTEASNEVKLYCVGDDWQSIFSFRGAEPSLMRNFDRHFNKSNDSSMVQLNKTFRFDNSINDASSKFLMKNPNQISKELVTHKKSDKSSVYLHWIEPMSIEDSIRKWVEEYSKKEENKSKNLLILFRYNKYNPPEKLSTKIRQLWGNGRKVRFKSLHSSKGHEEDVILIIGLEGSKKEHGRSSFPTSYKTDEILSMVLDKHDDFSFSDERRLLYVGMTRAKFYLHMLCDYEDRSPFADEIADYPNVNIIKPTKFLQRKCPACKTGSIRKLKSKYGPKPRYICNRDPVCNYVGFNCQQDGCDGLVVRGKYKSTCDTCGYEYENCKGCDAGILQEKVNSNTGERFLSCHTYRPNSDCKYTQSIKKNTNVNHKP